MQKSENQVAICNTHEPLSSDASILVTPSHALSPKCGIKESDDCSVPLLSPKPLRPSMNGNQYLSRSCPSSNTLQKAISNGPLSGFSFITQVCSSFTPFKSIIREPESCNSHYQGITLGSKRTAPETSIKIKCNCKKSGCLKKYCECYKEGRACQGCNCTGCENLVSHRVSPNKASHIGCNCKRSGCNKKYCECFQRGEKCGDSCKCEKCQNTSKVHAFRKLYEDSVDVFGKR